MMRTVHKAHKKDNAIAVDRGNVTAMLAKRHFQKRLQR